MDKRTITTAEVQSFLPDHYVVQLIIDPGSLRIIGCTPAGARAFGEVDRADLMGLYIPQLISPEQGSFELLVKRALSHGHHTVAARCRGRSGETWFAQVHIAPVVGVTPTILKLTLHDTTAQPRMLAPHLQ